MQSQNKANFSHHGWVAAIRQQFRPDNLNMDDAQLEDICQDCLPLNTVIQFLNERNPRTVWAIACSGDNRT
jgi:hypothetical protein